MNNPDPTTKLSDGREVKITRRVFTLKEQGSECTSFSGDKYTRLPSGTLVKTSPQSLSKRERSKLKRKAKNS